MTVEIFSRDARNPILTPSGAWWEARGVFNPGAAIVDGRVALIYRAVGADGLSRLGLAWSDDGRQFTGRQFLYEAAPGDAGARLGIEDPRLTRLDGDLWMVYTKASVAPVGSPVLDWEPAPFRVRMAMARVGSAGTVFDERPFLQDVQSKDGMLFPRRIGGRAYALTRMYPAIQLTSSPDLSTWSAPQVVLEPRPGSWEGERVGAGPPPIETPWGWLLIYHANEYYRVEGNRRHYRTGLAVLDRDDPSRVLYRYPEPILEPRAAYELEGPVGNVVFATGLIESDELYYLYYGAGDGVIALATAKISAVYALLERAIHAD